MRTMFIKRHVLKIAMLTCLTLVVGLAGVAFGAHPPITLRDFDGTPLDYTAIDAANGVGMAYSSKATCGLCHEYDMIEKHSYHAQIGANEWKGWDSFNPDHSDKYLKGPAAKGKNWVQSPGHLGKW